MLVLGIVLVGLLVVGMVFLIIFLKLEKSLGFGWVMRVIVFILLGMLVILVVFMKIRVLFYKGKKLLVDKSFFKDGLYLSFIVGGFFVFLMFYVLFFYIMLYGIL